MFHWGRRLEQWLGSDSKMEDFRNSGMKWLSHQWFSYRPFQGSSSVAVLCLSFGGSFVAYVSHYLFVISPSFDAPGSKTSILVLYYRGFIKRRGTGIFPFYWGNFPLLLLTNLQMFYHNNRKMLGQIGLCKQYRPRSDAAERGVWSGSILFAIHIAIF